MDQVAHWLHHTPMVARFCTQNGWVDADTLRYEIRERSDERLRVNVHFTEIVMEGAGCVAARVECFGQIELELGPRGEILGARVV